MFRKPVAYYVQFAFSQRRLGIVTAACGILLFTADQRIFGQGYERSIVMSGLNNPRGLAWGIDGGLYVAEAGLGGNGPSFPGGDGTDLFLGSTGAVSRWKDGQQARVLSGLPSVAPAGGANAIGLHDLVFARDNSLVGVIGLDTNAATRSTLGADALNLGQLVALDLNGSGRIDTLADLAAFEQSADPDARGVGSNPYGVSIAADGGFAAVDAHGNNLVGIADDGSVSSWAVLPQIPNPLPFGPPMMDPVPTAVALGPDGHYYVSQLTGFPFPQGEASIYRYDKEADNLEVAFTGFTNLIDMAFGEDGAILLARDFNQDTEALELAAQRVASQLMRHPHAIPPQLWMVAVYNERIKGDLTTAHQAYQRMLSIQTGDLWTAFFAAYLVRHDGMEAAAQAFASSEARTSVGRFYELILLSLRPESREIAKSKWIEMGETGGTAGALLAANILGLKSEARQQASKWKKSQPKVAHPMTDFLGGNGSAEDATKGKTKSDDIDGFINSNFFVAMKYLGDGNRDEAMKYLRRVVATGYYYHTSFCWAEGHLAQMERREDWPLTPSR